MTSYDASVRRQLRYVSQPVIDIKAEMSSPSLSYEVALLQIITATFIASLVIFTTTTFRDSLSVEVEDISLLAFKRGKARSALVRKSINKFFDIRYIYVSSHIIQSSQILTSHIYGDFISVRLERYNQHVQFIDL